MPCNEKYFISTFLIVEPGRSPLGGNLSYKYAADDAQSNPDSKIAFKNTGHFSIIHSNMFSTHFFTSYFMY